MVHSAKRKKKKKGCFIAIANKKGKYLLAFGPETNFYPQKKDLSHP